MTRIKNLSYILAALLVAGNVVFAKDRHAGTAIIRVSDGEYTIPIECDDASRPELGFSTEPSRITKENTGRTSLVSLRLRKWKDTDHLVVSLDRYVAWVPTPRSVGGTLNMTLDMSPASMVRDNQPVALTYDMWMDGDRPAGINGVSFEAQCSYRDPAAPAYRKM
ncbi:MAG: hypothetical protein OER91_08505 [Gammaproteobacteria bacterium]|nr:hypothetical protein [Gammaproteobacteria bacterium]